MNSLFNLLPEALDLKRDFPTLDAAKNISFQKVAFDIKKLEEDLHRLEAVRKNEKNSTALDRISIYVDQMTGEYTNVSLRYKQVKLLLYLICNDDNNDNNNNNNNNNNRLKMNSKTSAPTWARIKTSLKYF